MRERCWIGLNHSMIDLEQEYLDEVLAILNEHAPDCEVRAYGSRVRGNAGKFSDLDLVLIGEEALDWKRMESIKDAFSESDLPIMVDVLDWRSISESFRSVILDDYVILHRRMEIPNSQ